MIPLSATMVIMLCVTRFSGVWWRAGEIRGQIVFSNAWNYTQMLYAEFSGGSSVPTTPSPAFGTGQVALSNDGTMGIAFVGVSGAWDLMRGS